MYKVFLLAICSLSASTIFGQNTKWLVEAGTVFNAPRLIQESGNTNPNNYQTTTQSTIKPGFYVNLVNAPNYVFQHAFNFSSVAVGGSVNFSVLPNPTQNYPIPNPVQPSQYAQSAQFSYIIRTSIPGFIHKYGKRSNKQYDGKWDFLVGLGFGFSTFNRNNFNDEAVRNTSRQVITQGNQTGVAFSSFNAIGSLRLHTPVSLNLTYAITPKLNLRLHYDALFRVRWMGTQAAIIQSNTYVFNNQVVTSMAYGDAPTKHQFGLGIQYQLYQGKAAK